MPDRQYTPETIDIKIGYCSSFDPGFAHKVMAHAAAEMTTGHAADFDRWLEKHDREVQAQALDEEANAFDREVNERVTADMKLDVRCDVCGLRYGEREQYGCEPQGRAHIYDQQELDGVGVPLDAPTFYGDELRQKAARLRAAPECPICGSTKPGGTPSCDCDAHRDVPTTEEPTDG